MIATPAVGIQHVRAAALRISAQLVKTPCDPSPWLSDVAGRPVWVKWENLQRTGSFKLRGASNKLHILHERGVREVLAVSAGNHGAGVAYAAQCLGMRATIVVPENAAPTKVDAIRRYGAQLVSLGRDYDEAERTARRLAEARGIEFVSPYNDADVIAGQGTVALELCREAPRFEQALVPVGGGGLLAGAAIAIKEQVPEAEVIGVQPENSPAMYAAVRAGAIVPIEDRPTWADGLAGNLEPGSITLPIVRALAPRIELVPEDAIERAIRGLLQYEHMVVEGSGAVVVAALLAGKIEGTGPLALIVTGRNLDLARLEAILARTRE